MKGIVRNVIAVAKQRKKSLSVTRRFLRLKWNINVSIIALKRRWTYNHD
tara:strand:+ start:549 stop:695 length:147 start_codon:yes stop_codon:yes gene_type:complete